jgi:hypothetical protein
LVADERDEFRHRRARAAALAFQCPGSVVITASFSISTVDKLGAVRAWR